MPFEIQEVETSGTIIKVVGVGGAGVYSLICTLFHHNDLVTT